jgi:DNA-directed RNA polymerase specialized sigma24 family protein
MPPSSVTTWLQLLRAGDPAAAQRLWQRYYADLVRLAHDHLAARVRRGADAEDVALSAFASFCRGAVAGRFPQLGDRHDLWRLLFTITLRHAADHARREGRQRRGGGRHIDVADLPDADLDHLPGAARPRGILATGCAVRAAAGRHLLSRVAPAPWPAARPAR